MLRGEPLTRVRIPAAAPFSTEFQDLHRSRNQAFKLYMGALNCLEALSAARRIAAEELIREIETDLHGLIKRVLDHPYLRDLESGRVSKIMLGVFVREQYHTIGYDLPGCRLPSLTLASCRGADLLTEWSN